MVSTERNKRITVLISGNGSNLAALIAACDSGQLPATSIVRVICNRKDAYGLQRAEAAQIPTKYHNVIAGGYRKRHTGDEQAAKHEYDYDLAKIILEDQPDLVVCAGWMLVVSRIFIEEMSRAHVPVINLHPSLPGEQAIKGAGAIQRAYEMFLRKEITKTGCMIHYVIEEVDAGQDIVFQEVDMVEGESLEQLEQRIHEHEWELIVKGTRLALESIEQDSIEQQRR